MKTENVKSISDNLRKYDYLAEESDFIEVTEWTNGEGINVSFKDKVIHLSYGELDAINYLVKTLEYEKF